MGIIEVFSIGIGLAMDAFAVSICKGLSMKKMNWNRAFIIGTYFGLFQALMPILGYSLGIYFEELVTKIDHWIAFCFLGFIGINMIKESFSKENRNINDSIDLKSMIVLALATSIDAMAVGITFAFLNVNIVFSSIIIGSVTLLISVIGVKIGKKFGNRFEQKSEILGGVILIIIGLKILLNHLGII